MKSFIFYTSEGITLSPNNSLCENFQILGFADAHSKDIALEIFIKNNFIRMMLIKILIFTNKNNI